EATFNCVEKTNQRTCICWIRENIVSKCVLTFRRNLYIITSFLLTVLHVVIFHTNKRSIWICALVTIAVTDDLHIVLILLFTNDEILKLLTSSFWKFTFRTDFLSLAANFTSFNFFVVFFHFFI